MGKERCFVEMFGFSCNHVVLARTTLMFVLFVLYLSFSASVLRGWSVIRLCPQVFCSFPRKRKSFGSNVCLCFGVFLVLFIKFVSEKDVVVFF